MTKAAVWINARSLVLFILTSDSSILVTILRPKFLLTHFVQKAFGQLVFEQQNKSPPWAHQPQYSNFPSSSLRQLPSK